MTFSPDNRFSLIEAPDDVPVASAVIDLRMKQEYAALPLEQSLNAEGHCKAQAAADTLAYHWDIISDTMTWSGNAPTLLGCDAQKIATGKAFASLLDSQNFTNRYDTVMHAGGHDSGNGVGFEIEYMMRPQGKLSDVTMWVEDHGRWYAGGNGQPFEVYGLLRKADQRHSRDQQMNYLSNCDALTGMMNRHRMMDALGETISVSVAEKTPCAFAILAVNNLDVMNEAYGYQVADDVIVELSQRLRKVMRVGDGIARYSGSKFGIILNGCKPEELNFALERFMRAVRDTVIETVHGPVWALLSIGAVSLPSVGDNATKAVAHAEEALSEAFRLPSDGYIVFSSSEERTAQRLLNARCATEIVDCLQNGLFKLAYQPVFDAKSGAVVLHEALLRMADKTGAMITAGHLVPIAERLGLIRLIDRTVLQMALSTLQVYPEARLSVNVSATTANDPRWNIQLVEMIAAAPELAPRLVIEVTETAALGDIATSHAFLSALQRHGCGVALDDFGAGYTSYRNLMQLPLSMIKLDGSFCANIAHEPENQIFVKSMINLARSFGLAMVAEWVETEADAQMLRELGVDYLQGNHLGEASVEVPWNTQQTQAFSIGQNPQETDLEVLALRAADFLQVPDSFQDPASFQDDAQSVAELPDKSPMLTEPEIVEPEAVRQQLGSTEFELADGSEVDALPAATTSDNLGYDGVENESATAENNLDLLKAALSDLTKAFRQHVAQPANSDHDRIAS